uniref:Mediator of RNA polymerase II transcription subunit 24 n=3 Tax=Hirondellea gigas TaxID=1518452 RepID=A0A6A7G5M8_9CRUS
MVLESVGSSKASKIRLLLVRAWRERWSDMQWGIHIKTVLPRYISGDIYHMSDCILQQALMGPLPNQLILSYLRHSLAAHLVSYGAFIDSISKYESLNKVHCVRALLKLLSDVEEKITCRGKPEDCLALATSLVAGVRWLLRVILFAAGRVTVSDQLENLKKAVKVLQDYVQSSFLIGMLHIARLEDPSVWSQLLVSVAELETKTSTVSAFAVFKDTLPKIFQELRSTNIVRITEQSAKYDPTVTPICYGLHARILVEAVMHSTQNSQLLASQILLYQQLKVITEKDLYLELLVSCFLGLGSEEQFPHQNLHWVGFTFIKVPSIIQHIHSSLHGSASSPTPSDSLLTAVQQLATRTCLLDVADHRMNCNCLEYLLHELILRTSLLRESDASDVLTIRQEDPDAVCIGASAAKDGATAQMAVPNLILRAQTTVLSILKTLSNKNQESVLPVMNLLISGKSRDLLLTAAAASGKLFIYAQKFVKFNQQSLEPQPGETEQMAKSRALMFDITFLLLCHIAQVYGIDVVVGEESETFVENWMRRHMPEKGRVKMIASHGRTDNSGLIDVMQQVNAQDMLTKYGQAYWSNVCKAAPQIMQTVTSQVIHESASLQDATDLLDRMCSHLCSLPICFTAWTCSYLHEVSGAHATKVDALLNHLQNKLASQEPKLTLGSFKDRSMLMSQIVDNMIMITREPNILPKKHENDSSSCGFFSSLISDMQGSDIDDMDTNSGDNELSGQLIEVWNQVFRNSGLLSHSGLRSFQRLLRLGGHKWFVSALIERGMSMVFKADLNRAMDIIYGVFQIDIQQCCTSLLVHTFPYYLDEPGSLVLCSYRRIGALACLTVQILVAAWAASLSLTQQGMAAVSPSHVNTNTGGWPSRKRSFSIMSGEVAEDQLLKQIGILQVDPSSIRGLSSSSVSIMVAMQTLLIKLCRVVPKGVVSPVSELVVSLLEQFVVAPSIVAPLLTLLPSNLLPILVALHPPSTFTPCHLLALALPVPHSSFPSPLAPAQESAARRAAAKLLCTHRNFVHAALSVDMD